MLNLDHNPTVRIMPTDNNPSRETLAMWIVRHRIRANGGDISNYTNQDIREYAMEYLRVYRPNTARLKRDLENARRS